MADTLIACKTCGKDKASGAMRCPHCGGSDASAGKAVAKEFGLIFVVGVGILFLLIILALS